MFKTHRAETLLSLGSDTLIDFSILFVDLNYDGWIIGIPLKQGKRLLDTLAALGFDLFKLPLFVW